jgi:hypothetical protein
MQIKREFEGRRMDLSQQQPFSVATTEGSGKQRRGYMLRVRLSPAEVYSLKWVCGQTKLNESATIRLLLNLYSELVKAREITDKYEKAVVAQREFNSAASETSKTGVSSESRVAGV